MSEGFGIYRPKLVTIWVLFADSTVCFYCLPTFTVCFYCLPTFTVCFYCSTFTFYFFTFYPFFFMIGLLHIHYFVTSQMGFVSLDSNELDWTGPLHLLQEARSVLLVKSFEYLLLKWLQLKLP